MKWAYFSLVTVLISACASNQTIPKSQTEPNINVLSIENVIDKTQPDYDICKDFSLNGNDVSLYFSIAQEIDLVDSNHRAIILPCKYQGNLTIDNEPYRYEIYAGGSGYLYDMDGWRVRSFICETPACCSKFDELC